MPATKKAVPVLCGADAAAVSGRLSVVEVLIDGLVRGFAADRIERIARVPARN